MIKFLSFAFTIFIFFIIIIILTVYCASED